MIAKPNCQLSAAWPRHLFLILAALLIALGMQATTTQAFAETLKIKALSPPFFTDPAPTGAEKFGTAMSVDGSTLVVGVPDKNSSYGVALIYQQVDGVWQYRATLSRSDNETGDGFGSSVSISGNTIVVGAKNHDVGGSANQGSVYVFVRMGESWITTNTETARLTASDGEAGDRFGNSVAIHGDTIVVGADADMVGNSPMQGSAYVFVRPATGWVTTSAETAKLTASDGEWLDAFGYSVAISGDTIVVGSFQDMVGFNASQGSAYVFVRPATGWVTTRVDNAKLTASDGEPASLFGGSVAISGSTIVVGAIKESAYVFVRPSHGWDGNLKQSAKLKASDSEQGDQFGQSVAISGDTIVVGARWDTVSSNTAQGSAYVFARPTAGWSGTLTEVIHLTATNGAANDCFGTSVANNGDAILIGTPGDTIGSNVNQGSVYGYAIVPDTRNIYLPALFR